MKERSIFIVIILLASSNADVTLEECSHLPLVEGQHTNFYISKSELNCCMCPEGTFLEYDCSANDPNSTICTPCQENTYFPFGPHQNRECILDDVHCKDDSMKYIKGSSTSKSYCECPPGKRNLKDIKCIDNGKSTEPTSTIAVPLTTVSISVVRKKESPTPSSTPETSIDPVTHMVSKAAAVSSSNTTSYTDNAEHKIRADDPTNITENTTFTYNASSPKFQGNSTTDAKESNAGVDTELLLKLLFAVLLVVAVSVGFCIYKKCFKENAAGGRGARMLLEEEEQKSFPNDHGITVKVNLDEKKLLLTGDDEKEDEGPCTSLVTVSETTTKENKATPLHTCEQNQPDAVREVMLQEPQPPYNTDQHQCNCPREEDIPPSKNQLGFPSRCHIEKRKKAASEISNIICERDLNRIAGDLLHEGSEYDDIKQKNFGDTPETSRQLFKRVFEIKSRLTLWNLHDTVRFNQTLHNIVAKEITGPWTE